MRSGCLVRDTGRRYDAWRAQFVMHLSVGLTIINPNWRSSARETAEAEADGKVDLDRSPDEVADEVLDLYREDI